MENDKRHQWQEHLSTETSFSVPYWFLYVVGGIMLLMAISGIAALMIQGVKHRKKVAYWHKIVAHARKTITDQSQTIRQQKLDLNQERLSNEKLKFDLLQAKNKAKISQASDAYKKHKKTLAELEKKKKDLRSSINKMSNQEVIDELNRVLKELQREK